MSYLVRAFARLSTVPRSALRQYQNPKASRVFSHSYSSPTLHPQVDEEAEDMGKDKAQLSLKVPKGTQDCTIPYQFRICFPHI